MEKKAYLAVILIQIIYSGMFLFSKAAFNGGMSSFVFIFYRQAIATVFLTPVAFYFEWKTAPPMSFLIFCKIFMLSLLGISICLNMNGIALVYTSATLAAATTNSLPVITFFFALLFRMEVLRLKSIAGIAKLAGIVLCLGGVAILAFYKNAPQLTFFSKHHLFANHSHHPLHVIASTNNTWLKGCLLMLSSNILWGLWLVLQAFVVKSYPSKLLLTNLQCLLSSLQSFGIAIAFERNPQEWKLGWNVRFLAVAYCGIVVTAVTYSLQTWVIEKKGPVFLAMSTPLALLITIFASALFLGDSISLGSILGGLLLVGGLYFVLWGKSKEQKISSEGIIMVVKEVDKECSLSQLGKKNNTKLENENDKIKNPPSSIVDDHV